MHNMTGVHRGNEKNHISSRRIEPSCFFRIFLRKQGKQFI